MGPGKPRGHQFDQSATQKGGGRLLDAGISRGRRGQPFDPQPLPLQHRTRPDGAEAGLCRVDSAGQRRTAVDAGAAAQRIAPDATTSTMKPEIRMMKAEIPQGGTKSEVRFMLFRMDSF